MLSIVGSIWDRLKHGSVDWWGIAGLFVVACIDFFLLFYFFRSGSPCKSLSTGRSLSDPPPIENLGPKEMEALLSPLQLEAFRVAKDIRFFLAAEASQLPSPNPSADFEAQWNYIFKVKVPWENRIENAYELDFSARLRSILLKFGKEGLRDEALNRLAGKIEKPEEDLTEIAERIICLAHQADGLNLKPRSEK